MGKVSGLGEVHKALVAESPGWKFWADYAHAKRLKLGF